MAQFARLEDAQVMVADLSDARLDLGRLWLAQCEALTAGPELEARLANLTSGDPPFAVFNCTGSAASMMQSFRQPIHAHAVAGLNRQKVVLHDFFDANSVPCAIAPERHILRGQCRCSAFDSPRATLSATSAEVRPTGCWAASLMTAADSAT